MSKEIRSRRRAKRHIAAIQKPADITKGSPFKQSITNEIREILQNITKQHQLNTRIIFPPMNDLAKYEDKD